MKKPFISKYVIFGALAVAGLSLFYLLILINGMTYQSNLSLTPKANITVLAVGSIPTPDIHFLEITPTITVSPSDIVNGISVNQFVKIQGTEGAGLKFRKEPGTSSDVNFLANESEVFLVIGGPQTVNDIVWWQLATPYDQNRQGWASAEYLTLITD